MDGFSYGEAEVFGDGAFGGNGLDEPMSSRGGGERGLSGLASQLLRAADRAGRNENAGYGGFSTDGDSEGEGNGENAEEDIGCDVCRDGAWDDDNPILLCDGKCNSGCHLTCYGVLSVPEGEWQCQACQANYTGPCTACGKAGGMMKPLGRGAGWIHILCALTLEGVCFDNVTLMQPIQVVDAGRWEAQRKLPCQLCSSKGGALIKCAAPGCKAMFHPRCAAEGGMRLELRAQFIKAPSYCEEHQSLAGASGRSDGFTEHDVIGLLDGVGVCNKEAWYSGMGREASEMGRAAQAATGRQHVNAATAGKMPNALGYRVRRAIHPEDLIAEAEGSDRVMAASSSAFSSTGDTTAAIMSNICQLYNRHEELMSAVQALLPAPTRQSSGYGGMGASSRVIARAPPTRMDPASQYDSEAADGLGSTHTFGRATEFWKGLTSRWYEPFPSALPDIPPPGDVTGDWSTADAFTTTVSSAHGAISMQGEGEDGVGGRRQPKRGVFTASDFVAASSGRYRSSPSPQAGAADVACASFQLSIPEERVPGWTPTPITRHHWNWGSAVTLLRMEVVESESMVGESGESGGGGGGTRGRRGRWREGEEDRTLLLLTDDVEDAALETFLQRKEGVGENSALDMIALGDASASSSSGVALEGRESDMQLEEDTRAMRAVAAVAVSTGLLSHYEDVEALAAEGENGVDEIASELYVVQRALNRTREVYASLARHAHLTHMVSLLIEAIHCRRKLEQLHWLKLYTVLYAPCDGAPRCKQRPSCVHKATLHKHLMARLSLPPLTDTTPRHVYTMTHLDTFSNPVSPLAPVWTQVEALDPTAHTGGQPNGATSAHSASGLGYSHGGSGGGAGSSEDEATVTACTHAQHSLVSTWENWRQRWCGYPVRHTFAFPPHFARLINALVHALSQRRASHAARHPTSTSGTSGPGRPRGTRQGGEGEDDGGHVESVDEEANRVWLQARREWASALQAAALTRALEGLEVTSTASGFHAAVQDVPDSYRGPARIVKALATCARLGSREGQPVVQLQLTPPMQTGSFVRQQLAEQAPRQSSELLDAALIDSTATAAHTTPMPTAIECVAPVSLSQASLADVDIAHQNVFLGALGLLPDPATAITTRTQAVEALTSVFGCVNYLVARVEAMSDGGAGGAAASMSERVASKRRTKDLKEKAHRGNRVAKLPPVQESPQNKWSQSTAANVAALMPAPDLSALSGEALLSATAEYVDAIFATLRTARLQVYPKSCSDRAATMAEALVSGHVEHPRPPTHDPKTGEEAFCSCLAVHNPDRIYIGCDTCGNWYHLSCIGLSPFHAKYQILSYACPDCVAAHGRVSYVRQDADSVVVDAISSVNAASLPSDLLTALVGDELHLKHSVIVSRKGRLKGEKEGSKARSGASAAPAHATAATSFGDDEDGDERMGGAGKGVTEQAHVSTEEAARVVKPIKYRPIIRIRVHTEPDAAGVPTTRYEVRRPSKRKPVSESGGHAAPLEGSSSASTRAPAAAISTTHTMASPPDSDTEALLLREYTRTDGQPVFALYRSHTEHTTCGLAARDVESLQAAGLLKRTTHRVHSVAAASGMRSGEDASASPSVRKAGAPRTKPRSSPSGSKDGVSSSYTAPHAVGLDVDEDLRRGAHRTHHEAQGLSGVAAPAALLSLTPTGNGSASVTQRHSAAGFGTELVSPSSSFRSDGTLGRTRRSLTRT